MAAGPHLHGRGRLARGAAAAVATYLHRLLDSLKLHYLAAHLDDLNAEATRNRWGAQEIVEALVQREMEERQRRSVERRLRDARIGKFSPIASFDWTWPTHIDREHIGRLLTLAFMNDSDNVILAAAQGLGKTMVAKNIAYKAVLAGHMVLFTTAGAMLLDLSDGPRALQSRIRKYTAPRLLVVDEVGYLS
ncbi:MAG: ATP-binding protein [Alphaproteobacteria bacterium]|nr:ATP-binding protein [Alphaproteobacteria bacterium]MCB9686176.1 ATP-binding protein [Alphaproteobacteria bacterium]MCB9700069.1 ATP-binding protein [Alphaproteobacteria bacterium]MCB9776932.1 ATP-binding protein [Alphaproteobacteria bacterium]